MGTVLGRPEPSPIVPQANTIMTSINIAVGEVMPLAQRNYYLPRKKESDFILLVMDLIRRGLKVEMIAPDATYRADQSYTHLLSIQGDSDVEFTADRDD